MKTTLYLTGILALLVIAASCEKKERTTVVSGTVINAGSKQPIDSVKVSLLDGVSTAGEIIPGNTTSGKKNVAYSDKEGKFKVQITGEYEPFLSLSKQDYEAPQGGLVIGVRWGEDNSDKIFEMKTYAYFNPVLVSVAYVTSVKFCPAYFSKNTLNFECESGWEETLGNGSSQPFNNVPFLTYGDMFQKYKIDFRRNNILYNKVDSVYIKGFETYNDTIYF